MKSESFRAREAGFAPSAGKHYFRGMIDKPKRPRDSNQLAKFIVDVATGDARDPAPVEKAEGQRRGGLVGGVRRAENLSDTQRSDIAKAAAKSRWNSKKSNLDE